MKYFVAVSVLLIVTARLNAQYVYTIKADSVKITNCDSAELILENHTQNVPGFLFNTGNGRTIFKRAAVRLDDTTYLVGADTVRLPNAWLQGGNSFGTTGALGTMDNNPLDLYSNGSQRLRLTPAGHMLFGTTVDNGYNTFQFTGNIFDTTGYFTNFSSPFIGVNNSGAIRLRWGTSDGVYLGFYYQGNDNRRAYIATPADSRPFIISDQVGVSFNGSPFVAVGSEGGLGGRLGVLNASPSSYDDMAVARYNTTLDSFEFDMVVSPVGNTILGGTSDYGDKLQVNGNSNFNGEVGIGTPYPTAQLHTTGAVRFAGLTQDSTQTNVLVSDPNGNLYTRSLSSLESKGWLQGGNAFGTAGILGTFDNNLLGLYTNGNPRMYIFNDGNVAIANNVDAGYKFNVNGSANINGLLTTNQGISDVGPIEIGTTTTQNSMLANNLTFSTLSYLPNTSRTIFTFTNNPPDSASGLGYFRLIDVDKVVNRGTDADGEETAIRVDFNVLSGSGNDLRALHAARGNIIVGTGNIQVGDSTGSTSRIDITGANGYSQLRLRTQYTPTSSSDSNGNPGDTAVDDNYFYYKTSTGWKRAALSTF